MKIAVEQFRPLGRTDLRVPPIVFCSAALAGGRRPITDATKLAIGDAWFRYVESPVLISAAWPGDGDRGLMELGTLLRRLEVRTEEVAIVLSIDCGSLSELGGDSIRDKAVECWSECCQLLGSEYRPKLVSIDRADVEILQAMIELKRAGEMLGVGMTIEHFDVPDDVAAQADWISLAGGFTLLRHPPQVRERLANLARQHIPMVVCGALERGFLTGGSRFDDRSLNSDDTADRSLLAWRKAFVSLCEGHGITPAHACIQFALSAPGVVAVELGASFAERVVENVHSVCEKVPDKFWESMKEEGLLAADDLRHLL